MIIEKCVVGICFAPLDPRSPKLFGFPEFLTGLALMVIVWTISDVRYRFRVRTAPIPLLGITYVVVPMVGVLTLLTDLWRAEGWYVPRGDLLTPASWQALLAAVFLLTFMAWALFAIIRPPKFGRWNAKRYAQTLYGYIIKGSPQELAVIAGELMHSAKNLVQYATEVDRFTHPDGTHPEPPSKTEAYANELLLLIADKPFCRAVIESSPGTAWSLFYETGEAGKYRIRIKSFARNLVSEALANKDSFIYRETAGGYESGLIGYHQPVCQAMFSNFDMVEEIKTMLDPDFASRRRWDANQLEAYCRVVLLTLRDYVEKGIGHHSYVLYRALGYVKNSVSDLYELNGVANSAWENDTNARLRTVINFIKEAVGILEKKGVPPGLRLRVNERTRQVKTIYDHIANLIYEVIFSASAVTSPREHCWWIQHNCVWGELFNNFGGLEGPAGKAVKFKVCRLLYEDIAYMKRLPNFKGAKILAYCLNVMGLQRRQGEYDRDSRALHQAILVWTKRNYAWLYNYNPRVADACLVDGVAWDSENQRIVRTYPADGLRRQPTYIYLDVDPVPSATGDSESGVFRGLRRLLSGW